MHTNACVDDSKSKVELEVSPESVVKGPTAFFNILLAIAN